MTSFDILTLFPTLCAGSFDDSILRKAQENRLIQVRCLNIRDWATDKHHVTDEPPYGGGPGMVMKPDPIFAAVESIRTERSHVILMAPGGRRFNQEIAAELSRKEHLIFVCGHYEGIDQRVSEHLADDELSIGDYVLTNGAIAAAVDGGRDSPSDSRRPRRGRISSGRIIFVRFTGVPPIYPTIRFPGLEGPGHPALRQSPCHP